MVTINTNPQNPVRRRRIERLSEETYRAHIGYSFLETRTQGMKFGIERINVKIEYEAGKSSRVFDSEFLLAVGASLLLLPFRLIQSSDLGSLRTRAALCVGGAWSLACRMSS